MSIISWKVSEFKGVCTKLLNENEHSKEVQITMQEQSVMSEHKSAFDIILQLLKGSIEFEFEGQKLILKELDMITLKAHIKHSLRALEHSIIRLSVLK